jgi:predicted membrane-bound spermidine synthase
LLTATAAFAETFANPLALVLVVVVALLLVRPALVRLASASLGAAPILPQVTTAPAAELVLGMVGGVAAMLLYAELTLHFVLPAFRLARRCVTVVWQLTVTVPTSLRHLHRRSQVNGVITSKLPPKDGSGP